MEATTPVLIIGLICFLMGLAIGGMAAGTLRAGREAERSGVYEVARLKRAKREGSLLVEIGGRPVRAAAELDGGERTRLSWAADELIAWLGLPGEARPQVLTAAAPAPPIPEPTQRAGYMDLMARALQPEAINGPSPKSTAPTKSLAAQVDEILQEKLAQLPPSSSFATRAIRLMELPGKGLVVMVGLDQYDGVGSVPDTEIRKLIQNCVAEWEKKSGQ